MTIHPQRFAAMLAAVCSCGPALAQPAGGQIAPTVDNPNRLAVSGVPAARRFFQLAATRRVDLCIIGDSNTRAAQVGHESGMAAAFIARFGAYATPVEPGNGLYWWSLPLFRVSPYLAAPFGYDGAPIGVAARTFSTEGFIGTYALLAAGQDTDFWFNSGLTVYADSPLGIAAPLRYHATYWRFGASSPGFVNFTCRPAWPGPPQPNYAVAPTISSAGAPGMADLTLDVPAGPRSETGIVFCPANYADQFAARGPFCITYHRVENTTVGSGVAYSPLWGKGGQAAYNACLDVQSALSALNEWMRQATRLQNAPPVLLVQILHGGNDVGNHNASIGPIGGLDSSTPAGQEDNTRGIIAALRNAWAAGGRDNANLYFMLGPYHPRPDPDSPVPAYEAGWRDIAATDPQVIVVAGTMLSTTAELHDRQFTISPDDPYHLSPLGFATWGRTTMSALSRAICPGDYDENGASTVSDIFAFLASWFGGEPRADFDYSGTLTVQDIFDFLAAWFNGC